MQLNTFRLAQTIHRLTDDCGIPQPLQFSNNFFVVFLPDGAYEFLKSDYLLASQYANARLMLEQSMDVLD